MCPRVELILKIIIILLIIFLGFIKSKQLLIANNKNEEKILFPARGLNRDRRIPLSRAYYVFALTSCHSATPAEWITRVVHLPHSGETTTAERDDLHYKSSFLVKN